METLASAPIVGRDPIVQMPPVDQETIDRRLAIAADLGKIVPGDGVIVEEDERRAFESDGLTAYRTIPLVVVLPETTEQVAKGGRPRAVQRDHLQCSMQWRIVEQLQAMGGAGVVDQHADVQVSGQAVDALFEVIT